MDYDVEEVGNDIKLAKLRSLCEKYPRIKEATSSFFGFVVFMGGLGLHEEVETLYRMNPDALTKDLLLAVCYFGYPAPGVIEFLARKKPEELVINQFYDIHNFGYMFPDPNYAHLPRHPDPALDEVTLLQILLYREGSTMTTAVSLLEDDMKAVIEIWPQAIIEGPRGFLNGDRFSATMIPYIALLRQKRFSTNLIRFVSETFPHNLQELKIATFLFDPTTIEADADVVREGMDDDSRILMDKILQVQGLQHVTYEPDLWHQNAYGSFVEHVLRSTSLKTLDLKFPAIRPL